MRRRACGGSQEFLRLTSRLATLRRVCIPWVSKVLPLGRNRGAVNHPLSNPQW